MAQDRVRSGEDASSYLQQMIDSITDYEVIRLDEKGIVCSWHPGAQRLMQYAPEEVLGKPVTMFYTDEDVVSGRADAELKAAAETGRYETEGWRVRKDGTQVWVSVVLAPIRDRSDVIVGFVKVARDLTERREQDMALRSVQQMVDGITDYEVIRLDQQGVVRSWNPGAVKLTGYAADEVIGHHVSMFYT